jgi:fumarate reductase subunit C
LSAKAQTWLWLAQRASAAVLACCVAVHLVTMVYAVRGGLSAAEILARTRGSSAWFAFYAVFVLAVSIHAPIGLRAVISEWLRWRGRSLDAVLAGLGVVFLCIGLRAALAVFA